MGSKNDAGKPVSGEIIPKEDHGVPVVRALFAKLSRLPFKNFWQRKKISSMKEVIKEEKEFADVFVEHQQSVNRVMNIGPILRQDNADLEANALAAENRLAEEKRKEAARRRDDLIFEHNKAYEEAQSRMKNEYELKIQEAGYKKRLRPLEKEVARLEAESAQPKKKTGPSTTELFKEKDKIDKEYAKRKTTIESGKGSTEEKKTSMKLLDGWREEMYERVEAQYRREMDNNGPSDK